MRSVTRCNSRRFIRLLSSGLSRSARAPAVALPLAPALLLAMALSLALLTSPSMAADELVYADKDGVLHTVALDTVTKSDGDKFIGYIRVGGRRKSLRIEPRLIVSLWRGDGDAVNQWSKGLAKGKRLLAAGRIANQGPVSGAEEQFSKIAYSVENGTKGQEATERIEPWHNMYAQYHLIEARLKAGQEGNEAKLNEALDAIAQFRKRSAAKPRAKIDMQVPDYKGGSLSARVFGWGSNRLSTFVDLLEARVHAALKDAAKATAAYDKVISEATKKNGSPVVIRDAVLERAAIAADGKDPQKQEEIYRDAGTKLRGYANRQPDSYGRGLLTRAANQALLRGADLLFESALAGKYGIKVALDRYVSLRDSAAGRADSALQIGARTGVGSCLVEEGGNGQKAYEALLSVILEGYEHPVQVARALYYISKAAPQYADQVDKGGGKGDFLRDEAGRWKNDLQQRYPSSKWAKKSATE